MKRNEGMRMIAKLILNSFWGKMGEKTLRGVTKFANSFTSMMEVINDPTLEIRSMLPLGEECLQINCMPKEDCEDSLRTSSLINAAFTTCYGRLHLYKYLDMVGERAIYHDTDSVCYLSVPHLPDPPLGTHLGELTDQISDDFGAGSFCFAFVAGGAKNYSYKVAVKGDMNNVKVVTKVRGIQLNGSNEDIITFENLKAMVLSDQKEKHIVPIPGQIARLPGWKIITRDTSKTWQVVLNKRRRVDKAKTEPYGYKAWTAEDDDLLNVLEELALS
ncbi:uncharacterized protein LOC113208654 [Frankliniella occidentalis]|uniref:Uncharacterized protein LOC113208654 n=1 Tax=Frankliniella occidentalis TaxID=133901 RepID=A0A6J1SQD5_FRAOC|nr:uncharacterized protein LOC113208654 [Frankliniella occidentalis]